MTEVTEIRPSRRRASASASGSVSVQASAGRCPQKPRATAKPAGAGGLVGVPDLAPVADGGPAGGRDRDGARPLNPQPYVNTIDFEPGAPV
nr:hypothetical protein KitaXyl93_70180 [Kitasatospora sp. Xyl93]